MYDELRQSFEMFSQNLNKMTLSVKRKNFVHLWQMTMHDIFKPQSMNLDFVQKNCALNQDAYLNECVLKREIIVH